jgi:hypothetical protein
VVYLSSIGTKGGCFYSVRETASANRPNERDPQILLAAPVSPGPAASVLAGVIFEAGRVIVLLTNMGIPTGTSVCFGATVCSDVIESVRVKFFLYEAISG